MDFIKGADISMTRELEEHGAVYRWKRERLMEAAQMI